MRQVQPVLFLITSQSRVILSNLSKHLNVIPRRIAQEVLLVWMNSSFLPFSLLFLTSSKFNTHFLSWFSLSTFHWAITENSLHCALWKIVPNEAQAGNIRSLRSKDCSWLIRPVAQVSSSLWASVSWSANEIRVIVSKLHPQRKWVVKITLLRVFGGWDCRSESIVIISFKNFRRFNDI